MDTILGTAGRILVTLALGIVGWFAATWIAQAAAKPGDRAYRFWLNGIRIFLLTLVAVVGLHPFGPWNQLGWVPAPVADAKLSMSYQTGVRLGSKTVALGGGGSVTGIYFHPRQKDLVYIRTDVGGFYRWNPAGQEWIPLMESFSRSQLNYFGGEALALDPNDPQRLYVAVGKNSWFGPGTLLKSTDQGQTWQKLNLDLPLLDDYRRWVGERLAVNPFDSQDLLFGSWKDGLWRSQDAGATWKRLSAFAEGPEKPNVAAILYDPKQRGVVYAYADTQGIYQSRDAGATWKKLPDSPQHVMRMALASDSTLYTVGYEKPLVAKYRNGTWQDISPPDSDSVFGALSINPRNPKELVVVRGEKADPEMYRSLDGGKHWKLLSRTTASTVPWWTDYMRKIAWVSAIEFDPHVADRVWLVDWFGIWRTDQIGATPTAWTNYQKGHEEVAVFTLAAPPKGPLLLSGMADMDGFVHDRGLDTYPSKTFGDTGPRFQDTSGIAYCEKDPLRLVRVGAQRWDGGLHSGATSKDGGLTWQQFKSFPEGRVPLRVAMSATDPDLFVVTTSKAQPVRSTDGGNTWSPVSGLPDGGKGAWNIGPQSLVADPVEGNTFYYYGGDGKLYRSTDGGANFTAMTDVLPWIGWHTLVPHPGVTGDLWLALDEEGLRHSTNGGKTFSRIPTVEEAYLFDFGAPPPGSSTPALYLYGKVTGLGNGIFRSLDLGKTWTNIGDPKRPIGNAPMILKASRQKFGLVFVGTNGRGIYYGSV